MVRKKSSYAAKHSDFQSKESIASAAFIEQNKDLFEVMKNPHEFEKKFLQLSLSPELYEKIDKLALSSGVSRSSYISVLLAESIRQKDIASKALDDFPLALAEKLKEVFKDYDGGKSLS